MPKTNIYIIIPVYNEESSIESVIQSIKKQGYDQIIVVDDGSSDETKEIVRANGVILIEHSLNCGAGAATRTGLDAAKLLNADIAVTMDGDGQHFADDIDAVVEPILKNEAELVIGSRFLKKNKIPFFRRIYNKIGNFVTFIISGLWVSDSQSGFKAFSYEAICEIDFETRGYEFCSEIIRKLGESKLPYKEVPIKVKYSTQTLAKGQSFAVGIKTGVKLVIRSLMK